MQAGLLGTALAVAFWRYDALTCFFGYLVAGLFWDLVPAWIMHPSPLVVDGLAALALIGVAVLVGLVGLVDRSGPADNGGDAAFLELASLGAVDDHVSAVVPGKPAGERFGGTILLLAEGGSVGKLLDGHSRVGVDGMHARFDPAANEGLQSFQPGFPRVAGDGADIAEE